MSTKPCITFRIPGVPERLITDNGRAFQSQALCRLIEQLTEQKANGQ